MKVVLLNDRYGANLGAGVTAECLESGLRDRLAGAEIENCDLGGRSKAAAADGFPRALAIAFLRSAPTALKKRVADPLLAAMVRHRYSPHYNETINGADVVVFGSGDILTDDQLDSPMRVAAAAGVARERGTPMAIHAVGVGREWTPKGEALFKEAFAGADLAWTSVADPLSQARWKRHFARCDLAEPIVAFDPGFLAEKFYGPQDGKDRVRRNRPKIGLCVSNPAFLRRQFDGGEIEAPEMTEAFYQSLVEELAKQEVEVTVFTNGSPDDNAFLKSCFPAKFVDQFDDGRIAIAPSGGAPCDLVSIIKDCDGVVSHQTPISIIAYSYRIPHVGLAVNSRLREFFKLTDRLEFVFGPDQFDVQAVASRVQKALETPIHPDAYAALMKKVGRDLDDLANALRRVARSGIRPNGAF